MLLQYNCFCVIQSNERFFMLTNPVFWSVAILLILAALRLNVLLSLVLASVAGGLMVSQQVPETLKIFVGGLGNGASIAMNYALLGIFSVAIARSGITEWIAMKLFGYVSKNPAADGKLFSFKYILILILTLISISSQNLIPIHIAFIPILIPPLLPLFNKLQLDRRMVACILTFGLITPYMFLPLGFGKIYLNDVLLANIGQSGMEIPASLITKAMGIPAAGMLAGLLIAIFFSYRKPRKYNMEVTDSQNIIPEQKMPELKLRPLIVGVFAILAALFGQIYFDSMIVGSVAGVLVFLVTGVIAVRDTQDLFTKGVHLMGGIGLVMMAASGFAAVMRSTGGIPELVGAIATVAGSYKGVTVFAMLLVGLIVTMGIGSSFSTVPLIAAIYVPICIQLGISPAATLAIIGTAGALGDAGSPVSESVLGPTAGLNADGQHDHIYDSTIPTFLHYNLPLLAAGWIAGMVL